MKNLTRQQIIDTIHEGLYDDEGNVQLPQLLTRLKLEQAIEDIKQRMEEIKDKMYANSSQEYSAYDAHKDDLWRKEYWQLRDKVSNFEKEIKKLCQFMK